MPRKRLPNAHLTCLVCLLAWQVNAITDKFRISWVSDPATTAVIAWNQASGTAPVLHLDINDYKQKAEEYAVRKKADRVVQAKGMENHIVRLSGLRPHTTYYFLVKDSEGVSQRMFFTTAPNTPDQRLSIVAGGDSRNFRDARRDANLLVAKLRPHCVMFGGDFTESDSPDQWQEWLDDWQLTIAKDGRMTPIIVARGNHEASNQVLLDLFDVRSEQVFYAFSLGGDLVRIYTLNTLIPAGGEQKEWLENDLQSHENVKWKLAHYHYPMRPHTASKSEKNDQVVFWAGLFHQYRMNLVVECDAHVVKSTYPIRPDNGTGSDEGFIRDDETGTVYVGEGCWGAPLRVNNDDKSWTRASASFNQFHWIFIDKEKIEMRIVQTDGASYVADIDPNNIFRSPRGLSVWSPHSGDVVVIKNKSAGHSTIRNEDMLASRGGAYEPSASSNGFSSGKETSSQHGEDELGDWESCPLLMADARGSVQIKYAVNNQGHVVIRLVNPKLQEVTRVEFPDQQPGEHLKSLQMSHLQPGRYLAVVKTGGKVVRRYRVMKKD
jgi:hypothetical protein